MYSRGTRSAGIGLLVLASILGPSTQKALAGDTGVLGYWKHVDDDTGKAQSIFRLFEYQGKLVGRIVKVFPKAGKKPQTSCDECPGKQKNKPVVGLIFFWDFVHDEDDSTKWIDGKILNPEDGKVYNAEAELSKDGKTLKVFGYIRILFKIGGSSVWRRPSPDELRGI